MDAQADGRRDDRAVALPLVAYGAMLLTNLQADGAPAALVVIGPLAMGPPLLAAIIIVITTLG